jgi:photosystem II stability/assembly factor-like uncharacterized protein
MKKVIYPILFPFLLICMLISSLHAQWTDVSLPSPWSLQNASFTDPNNGYVIHQNKVFRTTDGGTSWDSISITANTWDVDFVSPTTGFLLTDSAGVFHIRTTTNGGNTWSSDTLPNNYYQMLRFTDVNNGFVANNFGSVYHTTNGGTNWTELPMGGYSSATDKEFTGVDTIIFTGWDGTFGYQGSVIRRDGSGTFQERIMATQYSQFQGTFFLNGHEGYAVFNLGWPSYNNYLTHTSDGGTSWDTILTDTSSTLQFHDVWMNAFGDGYISATNGTAGVIFKVTGNTKTIDFNTPKPIRRIHMAGNMLFAMGDGGNIFKNAKLMGLETLTQELNGIYPNPTSDFLKIPIEEVSEVSLINMNGQVVLSKIISPGDLLSLKAFIPGVYVIYVKNMNGISTAKVIVQ